ncbi:hypothetical protein D1AOALGA4SA_2179 [Olavius algarvensis Delta 1 endosymbiont]|nr:hypothetical protein D1AOALGA4SA_2179 [Olavius algarvensis Delta 1 endosymbiont]
MRIFTFMRPLYRNWEVGPVVVRYGRTMPRLKMRNAGIFRLRILDFRLRIYENLEGANLKERVFLKKRNA